MNPSLASNGGAVFAINMQCLSAALFGAVAWWAWPDTTEWWQLGFLSVILWAACAAALIKAARQIHRLWTRTRTILSFEAQGKAPKSSSIVSDDVLRASGMLDE